MSGHAQKQRMKTEAKRPDSSFILQPSSFMRHPSSFSPWPHRLAVVTACATVFLLFIGGLVTSKSAGLAVPDWPTTFGYNMFLYPWSKMVGNIFYEHSHRLVASAVGLLTIALALTFWVKEQRNYLRWLAIGALGLVCIQGVIGGLRVVLLEQTLAIVHAAVAQAFFGLTVSLAILTSHEWRRDSENISRPFIPLFQRGKEGDFALSDGGRLKRLCAMTTGFIYLQAIFGAVLRHTGEWLDAHLIFAALVAVHVILIFVRVMRFHSEIPKLARPAYLIGVLLLVQVVLGIASYLGKFTSFLPVPHLLVVLTTTHLVIGALLLATSLLLTLRSFRLSASKQPVGQKVLREQFSS
jgi:cytochrome c oxidase assembly protein subunit 15